ncbi:MAG: sulfotransferase [Frankiaceae bacterium]|nr:sulfotransferase [Frankiaceae bacterium]MBV9870491.1 sulfotransferase [Frankiaceae bacterium]
MPDDTASPPAHRPIFIVGANGSGTTLLRLILDSHEHIAIPPETGVMRLAAMHEWVPYWNLGDRWAQSLDLSETEVTARLAEFYGGLLASYADSQGKQRWGDKTPFNVWHLDLAARMFPDLQVVGIVRHPGAVASSLRRRFRRPVKRGAKHWKRSTTQLLRECASLGDRAVVLRYEDLVSSPEPVMRALLDWLGEPWSPAVLEHHTQGAAQQVEGFTRTDTPIDVSHVDAWTDHLSGSALERVAAKTGPLARFLNYEPTRPEPVAPLSDTGLLLGTALRERQRSSTINWLKAPRRPVADKPLRPPSPRRRSRRHSKPDLADVRVRDVVRHKVIALAQRRLPDATRNKVNDIRRKNATVDRIIGPR